MPTFTHKLSIILVIASILAVSPLCAAFSECQKLGEFCGDPSSETFPACCPFDTNANNEEQVSLKCKNVDNGVGTCETDESSSGEEEEN